MTKKDMLQTCLVLDRPPHLKDPSITLYAKEQWLNINEDVGIMGGIYGFPMYLNANPFMRDGVSIYSFWSRI